MSRYYNDKGEVAVLYSPEHGGGWSTWNQEHRDEMLFDPGLVALVLQEASGEERVAYIEAKWPGVCPVALDIVWLPKGAAFLVHEYDGAERVEIREQMDWVIA